MSDKVYATKVYKGATCCYTLNNPTGIPHDLIRKMKRWGFRSVKMEIKPNVKYSTLHFVKKGKLKSKTILGKKELRIIETQYQGTEVDEGTMASPMPASPDSQTHEIKERVYGLLIKGDKLSRKQKKEYRGEHRIEQTKLHKYRTFTRQKTSDVDMVQPLLQLDCMKEVADLMPSYDPSVEIMTTSNPFYRPRITRKERNEIRETERGIIKERSKFGKFLFGQDTKIWEPSKPKTKKGFKISLKKKK